MYCTACSYQFEKYQEYCETSCSRTMTFSLVFMGKLCFIYAVPLCNFTLKHMSYKLYTHIQVVAQCERFVTHCDGGVMVAPYI
jgi:hypothetical protein